MATMTGRLLAAAALVHGVAAASVSEVGRSHRPVSRRSASGLDCIYTHPDPPTNNPAVMIPLYTDRPIQWDAATGECREQYYLDVARGCRAVKAVINPMNGPLPDGHSNIPALQACVRLLSDHGVRMVGYVKTKQSALNKRTGVWTPFDFQPLETIHGEVNRWANQMRGIATFQGYFFDDTTNYSDTVNHKWGKDHIAFYRNLVNYARDVMPRAFIILNPGVFVHLDLVTPSGDFPYPADVSIPFENWASHWDPPSGDCGVEAQWRSDAGTFGPGPWCPYVPGYDHVEPFIAAVNSKTITVAAMAHTAPREFAFTQAAVAHSTHFAYFYATDRDIRDDPWQNVPSFWFDYLQFLQDGESATPPTASSKNSTKTNPKKAS